MSPPIAVDFSDARPTTAELRQNNVVLVIRYLTGSGGKAITLGELQSYRAVGIVLCFVFEIGATDAAGGEAAGVANAQAALAALAALGISDVPVYFAVDESIAPSAAVPYFQGINSVIPYTLTGVYGEGALCTLLKQDGLAAWFWQSESTSFPGNATVLPISHLQQKFNVSPIPGTDLDAILKADVGQWPRPTPAPAPTPTPPAPAPPAPTPSPQEDFAMFIATQDNADWLISGNIALHITSPADLENFQALGIKALPQPMSAGQWALFTQVG
jgi:hypothetical protein